MSSASAALARKLPAPALLLLLLAAAATAHGSSTPQQHDCDVIVVGAGSAGIAAARELSTSDLSVRVVEARSRPGGRVWTEAWDDVQSGEDVPVELGAQWLHGVDTNVLWPIAREQDVPYALSDDPQIIYGADNATLPMRTEEKLWDFLERFESLVVKAQYSLDADIPLSVVAEEAIAEYAPKGVTEEQLRWLLSSEYEHEYAADLAELSALQFDNSRAQRGGDAFMGVSGGSGFQGFLADLADGLDVFYNSPVTAIDYSFLSADGGGGVAVTITPEGGGGSTNSSQAPLILTARAVVVTLPLGVLQWGDVAFSPPLPARKRQAMGRMAMGLLDKVVLAFEGPPFWDELVSLISRVSPSPYSGEWAEWSTVGAASNASLLAGFNAGSCAKGLEAKSDQQVVDEAMSVLRGLYGDAVPPQPDQYWVTRWGEDSYSRGSYSYTLVGGAKRDRARLGEPVDGKLFFAGEATSADYPSTVNGAWESGEAAAKAVLSALGARRSVWTLCCDAGC